MTYFLVNIQKYIWASAKENLTVAYEQQTADQPVHAHSLITAFVIHSQESITPKLVTCQISIFYLFSVAE